MRTLPRWLVILGLSVTATAAQTAPAITTFTINNGAAEATTDAVTLRFTYTNPAAVGQPIKEYRLRYKPPTQGNWFAFGAWQAAPSGTPAFSLVLARNGSTPIPGDHRYQLQLRDVNGQMSATAEAAIRRVVSTAPASPAPVPTLLQTYRVTGGQIAELVRVAKQRGFRFTALPGTTNSTCEIEDQANEVIFLMHERTIGQPLPRPECRFRAFEGNLLQPNWRLQSVAMVASQLDFVTAGWVFEQPLKPAGRDASFVFYGRVTDIKRFSPPIGLLWIGAAQRRIDELVLEGPVNSHWRRAFEP